MPSKMVTKNYAQMRELAEAISPKAKVRKKGSEDIWEIYIPTDFHIDVNLSEDYKGTPAWDAYNQYDAKYGNELERWSDYSGYDELPVEAVADFYNCEIAASSRAAELLDAAQKETGISPEVRDKLSKEQIRLWFEMKKEARKTADLEFQGSMDEINKKWIDFQ